MGKALIIKNVNFNTNKLTTVNILADIACTAISLNKSSTNLTVIGATETLTASVSPSGCTDIVSWSSSDTNVVTVNSGVLTETGIGTATITATCGSYSATCTVTTINTLSFDYIISRYNHKSDATAEDYVYNEGASGSLAYACIIGTEATTKTLRGGSTTRYPILLGTGASKLNFTVPTGVRATVWFTDSTQACTYASSHSGYDTYALLISGDSSAYDSKVATGNRELDVPEGADSFAASIHYPGGSLTDELMQTITIVAS